MNITVICFYQYLLKGFSNIAQDEDEKRELSVSGFPNLKSNSNFALILKAPRYLRQFLIFFYIHCYLVPFHMILFHVCYSSFLYFPIVCEVVLNGLREKRVCIGTYISSLALVSNVFVSKTKQTFGLQAQVVIVFLNSWLCH